MKNIQNSLNLSAIGLVGSTFASQLIGVWALVSYTDEQPNGKDTHPFGPLPQGFLIYTEDGFFSAQLMKPGRSVFCSADWWHHGTLQEYQEAGSGYIGYCGTYEVDEEKATVTHIASVALLPNLILGRQRRSIDLQGDRLTLRTAGVPLANGHFVTSRLEWQRANPITTASV
jgi:Lipocalin-like domain